MPPSSAEALSADVADRDMPAPVKMTGPPGLSLERAAECDASVTLGNVELQPAGRHCGRRCSPLVIAAVRQRLYAGDTPIGEQHKKNTKKGPGGGSGGTGGV